MSIPKGFFLNTTVKNGGCGYFEAAYFAPPFLCPMNAQNIFLLIDGFVVSISLLFLFICFFTFMWPGLLLLDLAKNNACFFFLDLI